MSAKHITAASLVKQMPNAECCDCSKEADAAHEEETWTIWNQKIIYCPRCARYEGIGPDC